MTFWLIIHEDKVSLKKCFSFNIKRIPEAKNVKFRTFRESTELLRKFLMVY